MKAEGNRVLFKVRTVSFNLTKPPLFFCRYIMLFKKDSPPSEGEFAAYRRGETWSEEKAEEERKRYAEMQVC